MKSSKVSYIMVWQKAFYLVIFLMTGLLSLSSCESHRKPSFIIVAVDRLGFNSYNCSDDKSVTNSGLALMCKEALRFTHAYTTSVQPAAALGSLLTAEYPYQHKLHRNSDRIDTKLKQVSELAQDLNYRTAFFGGSPAIMKKTGLGKGFDLFDDLSFINKKNYLTDFQHLSDVSLQWIKESSDPHFTLLYSSELETFNEAETDLSRFDQFDEKLSVFFEELKKNSQWESNYVILVGLQGRSDYSRPKETNSSNLHSENTNVILFIKPPRQKGDEGTNWKIDSYVTLADLGLSLFKTLNPDYLKTIRETFDIVDFSYLWSKDKNKQKENFENRKIIIEATNTWKHDLEIRFATIFKNFLLIENESDALFNRMNDGLETIDISVTASANENDFKNEIKLILADLRSSKQITKWTQFQTETNDIINLNRDYWSQPSNRDMIFELELNRYKKTKRSNPLTALMIQHFILKNKIELLEKELKIHLDLKKINLDKDIFFEDAKRQSLNLTFENLWGIWQPEKKWNQSAFISEYQ